MIREFFYLQKSDRKVIIVLLCVIAIALGVIFLTGGENDESNALTPADTLKKDSFRRPYYHRDTVYVRTKVIYRDRPDYSGKRTSPRSASEPRDSFVPRHPVKIKEGEHVILNTADTTALKTVPGIGPYFAAKMVSYRASLRGYSSPEQLMDIYHFDQEKYDGLKDLITCSEPAPYPLWTLPEADLSRHPYISKDEAHSIVLYRTHQPRETWTLKGLNRAGILSEDHYTKLSRCAIETP